MRLEFIVILFIGLFSLSAAAENTDFDAPLSEPVDFDSQISNVMVYRSGVRITRDAQINIPAGQTEIVFSNLTTQINTHSLQAYVPDGVDLVTVHYKTNFLKNLELPQRAKDINTEMESLALALDWNKKQYSVYVAEEKILTAKPVELNAGDKGISVEDLMTYTAYYRQRALEIKKLLFDLGQESTKLKTRLATLKKELNEMQTKKNQKTGEVTFLVQSAVARQCDISFSYISNQAGWVPVYDLKAKDVQSQIALNLKANVYQNTGVDWKDVKLSVSTGNPLLGNDRPILRPNYITFAPIAVFDKKESLATQNMAYKMKRKDDELAGIEQPMISGENSINDTETTREYIINQFQTVPSSGLKRLVQLHRYDLDAKFKYHAVPKINHGVFLLAEIANWGKYNLLPGTANIFFQNTYIGQSQINSTVTADTLLLSLGRDESIKIQRERTNYFEESKFLGSNEIRNIEYTISVKNTKGTKINIEILDQIPISQHEDIKIELGNSTNAVFSETLGGLKWDFELLPGSSKKLVFDYIQKSPKNASVALR